MILRSALTLLLAGAAATASGEDGARLFGAVRDESGLALPGVLVDVDASAGGPSRSATTDRAGAYEMAGLKPTDVSMVECHATGTPVGDATELKSMARVFAGASNVPIGSLKSNLGHLITAAGVAGLIKVLAAMEHGKKPREATVLSTISSCSVQPCALSWKS